MKHVIILLLLGGHAVAQLTPDWDTLYYQRFRTKLIVGIFQAFRNFDNQFEQRITADPTGISKHFYMAESNHITGIDVTYDKLSFAVGLRSVPPENPAAKGKTETFIADLRFGGNKWLIDNSIRYFRGFYDFNTPNYDSTFKKTGKYYYQPSFTNTLVRSKFLYFTNHRKYSVRSGTTSNYRQLKSAATWVLSGNINYNELSNDSSFFPAATRDYYGDYASLHRLSVLGISANAGAALTLVFWRAVFFQALFIAGPEQQWRTYNFPDKTTHLSYVSISGEVRGSLGFNFHRWYLMSFSRNDFTFYNNSAIFLQNRSLSGGLIVGVRLNTKSTPKPYERFQKTWLYRNL
jgi:hypothetical protein